MDTDDRLIQLIRLKLVDAHRQTVEEDDEAAASLSRRPSAVFSAAGRAYTEDGGAGGYSYGGGSGSGGGGYDNGLHLLTPPVRRLCLAFPLPSRRRHCLCHAFPLYSRLRQRRCLVFTLSVRRRHCLCHAFPLPSRPRQRLHLVSLRCPSAACASYPSTPPVPRVPQVSPSVHAARLRTRSQQLSLAAAGRAGLLIGRSAVPMQVSCQRAYSCNPYGESPWRIQTAAVSRPDAGAPSSLRSRTPHLGSGLQL